MVLFMEIKQVLGDFKVIELLNLPLGEGPYSYYLLRKENMNTLDAIEIIAKKLGINRKYVGFAGMKDKKAITEQFISFHNIGKERVDKLDIKGVFLSYVGCGKERITLGMLKGNHFDIVVKDLKDKKKLGVDKIKNYFGPQRYSVNNAQFGRLLLQRKFKEVCEALGFEVEGNDYIGALRRDGDRKLLRFYIHAYQSYLWDTVARDINDVKTLVLIGYLTDFEDKIVKEKYDVVLDKDGIEQRDFLFREFNEISCEGDERGLYMCVRNLDYNFVEGGGSFECHLSFDLDKGQYATTYISSQFE